MERGDVLAGISQDVRRRQQRREATQITHQSEKLDLDVKEIQMPQVSFTRSKSGNDNGAEPRFSYHSYTVQESQGPAPWYAGPTATLCSPRHDDMPILNGMVQPVDNEAFISAESDGESEAASYFRAPFTQLLDQSSDGEEADGDCPPSE